MKLGICEGTSEIIAGESLPLECNLDYLDGGKCYSFDSYKIIRK